MNVFCFRNLTAFIIGAFISNAFAGTPVWIRGNSCIELIKEFNQICVSQGIQFSPLRTENCQTSSIPSAKFQADIQSCLEPHVKEYLGREFIASGPNCWGGAMYYQGGTVGYIDTGNDYFGKFLESPACRKIQSGEERRAGDLIRIRGVGSEGGSNIDNHGLVYLNPRLAISKNGMEKFNQRLNAPILFEVQELSSVLKNYHVTEKKCDSADDPLIQKECDAYTTYYRCGSFRDFFDHEMGIDQIVRKDLGIDLEYIESLENSLQTVYVDSLVSVPHPDLLGAMLVTLFEIESRYEKELNERLTMKSAGRLKDVDDAIEKGKLDRLEWIMLLMRSRAADLVSNIFTIQNLFESH